MFNPKIETLSARDLATLQLEKLRVMVKKAPLTRLYRDIKVSAKNICTLKDLSKIPFTTKEDLRRSSPFSTLVIHPNEVSEVHMSSATTGIPVYAFTTKRDLRISANVLARTWKTNSVRKGDIVQMMASYGLFTGGLLNHYALVHLGACVIPIGPEKGPRQIKLMQEFKTTVLAGVVSQYYRVIYLLKKMGILPSELNLRCAIAAGEPYSESTRKYIESSLNLEVFDQYGLAEINTGLAGECEYHNGLHIQADYALPEIIDPDSGENLPEGAEGELILTLLEKEANVLLRYRTGDVTSITYQKCKCGRTLPRIKRIKRRLDQIIFVKGIKLDPALIDEVVTGMSEVLVPHAWKAVIERIQGIDRITLEVQPAIERYDQRSVSQELATRLREATGIGFNMKFVADVLSADDYSRPKVKRVIDLRK